MLHTKRNQTKRANSPITGPSFKTLLKCLLVALALNQAACASLTSDTPPQGFDYGQASTNLWQMSRMVNEMSRPVQAETTDGRALRAPTQTTIIQQAPYCANPPYCTTSVGY